MEFVVDPESGEPFLLVVNCRIQVEHPVTEAGCDRDLVAVQLRIADGHALGFRPGRGADLGHPDFQRARVTTDWLERVVER